MMSRFAKIYGGGGTVLIVSEVHVSYLEQLLMALASGTTPSIPLLIGRSPLPHRLVYRIQRQFMDKNRIVFIIIRDQDSIPRQIKDIYYD
jgi:hypothetical protein